MCLQLEHLEPKIADKDIVCYKIVNRTKIKGVYKSNIQEFEYIIRRLYTNNISMEFSNNIIKHFKTNCIEVPNCYIIEGGMFHSYKNYISAMLIVLPNEAFLKCIIPKGAYYYEGHFHHFTSYASSQIKILEEI